MPRLSPEQLAEELKAQKARAQARQYLEKHGVGPGEMEARANKLGEANASMYAQSIAYRTSHSSDNTLELVMNRRAESRRKEEQAKAALLEQQLKTRTAIREKLEDRPIPVPVPVVEAPLPAGWKAVTHKESGKIYFWNTKSNETRWERPPPESAPDTKSSETKSSEDQPAANDEWEAKVHAATGQVFYQHKVTGEKRATRPLKAEVISEPDASGTKRKSEESKPVTTQNAEESNKKTKLSAKVDPLDPLGGRGGRWADGLRVDRMADSTASGPLWQQRPYPAPGAVLKGKR